MKHLLILLLLASCSPNYHVKKAIKKGWTPEKETIEVERLELIHTRDTITNEIIHTDTIRTKETRTIFQDRPLLRYETKLIRDTVRITEKANTARLKQSIKKDIQSVKIEKKRSKWWLWLLIGLAVGVFRKQLFQIAKKVITLF